MNKNKKVKQEFNTFAEHIKNLHSKRSEYKKLYFGFIEDYKKSYTDRWLNNGGCNTCMGFKSESVIQIENNKLTKKLTIPCNECEGKSEEVNLAYAFQNNIEPYSCQFQDIVNKMYGQIFKELMNINLQISILEKYNRIEKNKLVIVARGRKFPIGLKGKVLWVGPNQYGSTTKIRTGDGDEYLIDSNNIEVINCDENKY